MKCSRLKTIYYVTTLISTMLLTSVVAAEEKNFAADQSNYPSRYMGGEAKLAGRHHQ